MILLCTAFFTPLKIYYIILGSIALVLAIISISPLGKETAGQNQSFKELFSAIGENQSEEKIVVNENFDKSNDEIDIENEKYENDDKIDN